MANCLTRDTNILDCNLYRCLWQIRFNPNSSDIVFVPTHANTGHAETCHTSVCQYMYLHLVELQIRSYPWVGSQTHERALPNWSAKKNSASTSIGVWHNLENWHNPAYQFAPNGECRICPSVYASRVLETVTELPVPTPAEPRVFILHTEPPDV